MFANIVAHSKVESRTLCSNYPNLYVNNNTYLTISKRLISTIIKKCPLVIINKRTDLFKQFRQSYLKESTF